MALPSVGGGYQVGDGNLNEVSSYIQNTPATAADTATLTVAQLINGILLSTPTAAAAYTLPLGTDMDTALGNFKIGSAFMFSVVNLASNAAFDITMTTNTGWTLTGNGVMVVQELSSARFVARKTGTATWALTRLS